MRPLGEALENTTGRKPRDLPPPKCDACQDWGCWGVRYWPDLQGGGEQVNADAYCIRCDLGKVMAELHERARARLTKARVDQQLAKVGRQLPPGMASYSMKSYVQAGGAKRTAELVTKWLDVEAQSFVEGEDPWQPWLYLGGTVGAGKTGAVVPALLEHCRRGGTGAFITVPDWLNALRDEYGRNGVPDDAPSPMYGYQQVDLLVLDDIGVERNTDWSTEQLFMLINHRATNRKRTVITSNLLLHDLRTRLASDDRGRRIPSRIMEMCWGEQWVLSLSGKDLRQTKRTAA